MAGFFTEVKMKALQNNTKVVLLDLRKQEYELPNLLLLPGNKTESL